MNKALVIAATAFLLGAGPSPAPKAKAKAKAPEKKTEPADDCPGVDDKLVQDELGPGFGKIIQTARLVPNTTENVMNGFKIFAIEPGTLLAKTGLENGDVIVKVNDETMDEPSKGFALFQAFQDEKEIRIFVLRGGKPKTIVCRIKPSSK